MKRYFWATFLIIQSMAMSYGQAETKVDFSREILPILSDKCFACHGPDAKEKELRLDSFEGATSDRGGYHAIDLAKPEESEMLIRMGDEDDPMPPVDAEKQLSEPERLLLEKWVRQGGEYAKHWAFVPPVKVDTQTGIDGFVGEKLKRAETDFAAEADRATLARRVAFILTGLPPEPDQLEAFLSDKSEDAYEKFVEVMLESPGFGEHQARYWLDAVRYGDTHGLHLDNKRGIYPYRDWVVRALNENLPMDEFITWQLAGDLLPNPTLEQQVATGFVRMNPTTSEGGVVPAEFQAKNNFDRTETLGTVFLGVTMSCARCHTHKYDPIVHDEYYSLLAFFNSTAENPLDGNKYEYGPVTKAPEDHEAWDAWAVAKDEAHQLLDGFGEEAKPWRERLLALAEHKEHASQARAGALSKVLADLEAKFTTTLVARELEQPRPTKLLVRGEYSQPSGPELAPDVPEIMGGLPPDAPRDRLGLAQWLTAREHPMVSRVLINRVWQRVFGDGLVRTPEDFGVQGEQPTHPELLDWLAVELQDSGWDLKHMLRLMVHSRTFKQASAWRSDLSDPENRLFARGPSFRLDAEVIRDLALWASELLDPHMGGPGVKPYQPSGLWSSLAHPASNTKKYERDEGKLLYRRSLYVYWKRTSPHPMMTLFDAPSRESSCVRRSRSSTSLQSLALFNETQRLEMGRMLGERLLREAEDDQARLDRLFHLLACRPPTETEREACGKLITAMRKRFAEDPTSADALLSAGEAPRNPDLDPIDHATWAQVATTVLASDVALLLY